MTEEKIGLHQNGLATESEAKNLGITQIVVYGSSIERKLPENYKARRFIQLQYTWYEKPGLWDEEFFDQQLNFLGDNTIHEDRTFNPLEYARSKYDVVHVLPCGVYKDPLGDCTNGGISSYHDSLDLISNEGSFTATNLFRLVEAENRHVYGDEHYMDVIPVIYPVTRSCMWMSGGNILYSSDARFEKTTGSKYPLCIHDRYEG